LIREECGEALAAGVAEDMVVYLRRSPRDTEESPFLLHRWATPPNAICSGSPSITPAFRRCTI
jgi:transcriptional regulator GlxA family with amidase domain